MRKSTITILAIMLVGMGGMLMAANTMLGPLARDAETAKRLTRWLERRGDIRAGSRVRALRLPGGPDRLAAEDLGLLLEMEPSTAVALRPGGLRSASILAAEEMLAQYPAGQLAWVEVAWVLSVPPGAPEAEAPRLRAVLPVEDGELGEPRPPLPDRLPVRHGRVELPAESASGPPPAPRPDGQGS